MGSSPEGVVGLAPQPKPKQSKSRNGCGTCKAKRLKCDESKPACRQCHKRGVTCGGYKKDFKWRQFGEGSFGGKAHKVPRRGSGNGGAKTKKQAPAAAPAPAPTPALPSPVLSDISPSPAIGGELSFGSSSPSAFPSQYATPLHDTSHLHKQYPCVVDPVYLSPMDSPVQMPSPAPSQHFPLVSPSPSSPEEQQQGNILRRLEFDGRTCLDVGSLLPSANGLIRPTSNPMQELVYGFAEPVYSTSLALQNTMPIPVIVSGEADEGEEDDDDDDDDIEQVIRSQPTLREEWITSVRSPSPASSSSSSGSYTSFSSRGERFVSINDIFRRPSVTAGSQELLITHFDKHTCGIMSVKDGINENPWRTLVWPLARDSPALYHAIASMTAFHMCEGRPGLRVEGMEHMRKSIHCLNQGLFASGDIDNDAALATTLVLAFAEAFDRHIATGIEHLRGAKVLVGQALTKHSTSESSAVALKRFRFLHNVWVYLDVLARLTSDDDDGGHGFGIPVVNGPLGPTGEVDPLLGCAATLFPLIGRVASLVQRVRKTDRNTFEIIASAIEVKELLERWTPEAHYENPQDPSSNVSDALKTAEAYRWATLLYLHQAVPELPSLSAQELAEKVMVLLASIPMTSRSCIIHIYPLLVAGCEAVTHEDRRWVRARWRDMCSRLWIGNVAKAWEVVKEVWDRRDRFMWESQGCRYPRVESGRESLQVVGDGGGGFVWSSGRPERKLSLGYEGTVRGRLHWVGVMRDRRWEVLLG